VKHATFFNEEISRENALLRRFTKLKRKAFLTYKNKKFSSHNIAQLLVTYKIVHHDYIASLAFQG
jgi:hypothetical protein